MSIAIVNLIFAALFLWLARATLHRALPFLRTGWQVIDAQVQHPDYRRNVERRRAIGEGSNFLLGGIVMGAVGLGALALGIFLAAQELVGLLR